MCLAERNRVFAPALRIAQTLAVIIKTLIDEVLLLSK